MYVHVCIVLAVRCDLVWSVCFVETSAKGHTCLGYSSISTLPARMLLLSQVNGQLSVMDT